MKNKDISVLLNYLDLLYPLAECELEYKRDYELLIATVLSAQCTDKRVNMVTKVLWSKYDLLGLSKANLDDIMRIIRPCGNYYKKSYYIKTIATRLLEDYDGVVPNDRNYLESLPGVGRKTCNVVLANIFNEQTIAVDTHVNRVSKRLNLASLNDSVYVVEQKLMKVIPFSLWSRFHHQMVLFGRYNCKAINPLCENCKLKEYCKEKNKDF